VSIRNQFTAEELEAIREATRAAENQTGGELVCVIVQQADVYEASLWKAAALGALGGTVVAGLWFTRSGIWVGSALPWILLPATLGAAIATLLAWAFSPFRRALVSPALMDLRVDRRAGVAFLEEEVFDTLDRTGVLVFVSLFEHGIRILRDKGVEQRVPEEAWEPIVDELAKGLRSGRKGPAIAAAVAACGQLLHQHGVPRRADDRNELDDEPRLYNE
jgi:putative membrane protein